MSREVSSSEYPGVLSLSSDRDALLRAHGTSVTQDAARELVFEYLDEWECSQIDFSATTMRGRAFRDGRLRLPKTPTLGLVLHEIAHLIDMNDHGGGGHGHGFVRVLDGLVWSERHHGGLL